MSVIVWDGKTLAADTQTTSGNLKRAMSKIWRHGDILIAGAGMASSTAQIKDWVIEGMHPKKFPKLEGDANDYDVWVINRNGTFAKLDNCPHPLTYSPLKFMADGSGRDFAYGALEMGADARTAVEVACKYDIYCGGAIEELTFD